MQSNKATRPPLTEPHAAGLGASSADRLRQRITALRATIAAGERKRTSIDTALAQRRAALCRIQAQLVLELGSAPTRDE